MTQLVKYTIALVFSFFLFGKTHAQGFKGSLVAGFNASQITGDSMAGFNKFGLLAGAMVKRPLSARSSFELGFLFSQKGSRSGNDTASSGIPKPFFGLTLNYIEIPILYQYEFKDYLAFTIGPYFGILNGATYNDGFQDYEKSANFYRLDYGLSTGVQVIFSPRLALDIRAVNSIVNFLKFPLFSGLSPNTSISANYYNVVTSFGLRYTIN